MANSAVRNLSKGEVALGLGLLIAVIAVFLPWYYGSASVAGYGTVYSQSIGGFSSGAGWLFFLAALAGVALFILRTFVRSVALPWRQRADRVIYLSLGIFMALMAVLFLVVNGGQSVSGPGYSAGPGIGVFLGIVAAILIAVCGLLKRSGVQSAHIKPSSGNSESVAPLPPPLPPAM
jgi:hypothetical protein